MRSEFESRVMELLLEMRKDIERNQEKVNSVDRRLTEFMLRVMPDVEEKERARVAWNYLRSKLPQTKIGATFFFALVAIVLGAIANAIDRIMGWPWVSRMFDFLR